MGKDKPQNKRGKISVMRNMDLPDYHDGDKHFAYETIQDGFDTTEHAKIWLRANGETGRKFIIVQVKTEVTLEQQTITKLITTSPSVE